jgi:hypothetical protein
MKYGICVFCASNITIFSDFKSNIVKLVNENKIKNETIQLILWKICSGYEKDAIKKYSSYLNISKRESSIIITDLKNSIQQSVFLFDGYNKKEIYNRYISLTSIIFAYIIPCLVFNYSVLWGLILFSVYIFFSYTYIVNSIKIIQLIGIIINGPNTQGVITNYRVLGYSTKNNTYYLTLSVKQKNSDDDISRIFLTVSEFTKNNLIVRNLTHN